jgi:LmbE family N-acetylglucosaminyl deacetylase
MNKILVVAVHPDDETLGCGGTLLKHKAQGDKIFWLLVTSIHTGQGFEESTIRQRGKEKERVAKLYQFDGVEELDLPTTTLAGMPEGELIHKIAIAMQTIQPNVVYLPFSADIHSDHRKAFEAAYSCTKSFRSPFIKKILMMETISETEFAPPLKENAFVPNYFVDITGFMDQKIKIVQNYKSELGTHPFPRNTKNIRALATFRGAIAGCEYAEAFMLLKEIH